MSHLTDILKVIVDYKQKLKHKHKETSQANVDETPDSEDAPRKQACQDEITWFHFS